MLNYGEYVLVGVGSLMFVISVTYSYQFWKKSKYAVKDREKLTEFEIDDDENDNKPTNNGAILI